MNNTITHQYKLTVYSDAYMGNLWQEYEQTSKIAFVVNNFDFGDIEFTSKDDYVNWLKQANKNNLATLPLYVYDHSGIKFELTPSCPWDSAHVGFIFIEKGAIYGKNGQHLETKNDAVDIIHRELDELNLFFSEGWFGFYLENEKQEVIESCTGFLGFEGIKAGLKDHLASKHHHLIEDALNNILYY